MLRYLNVLIRTYEGEACYQMLSDESLRKKTSTFESQAYARAESRIDYLRQIAGGLSNLESIINQQSGDAIASKAGSSSASPRKLSEAGLNGRKSNK